MNTRLQSPQPPALEPDVGQLPAQELSAPLATDALSGLQSRQPGIAPLDQPVAAKSPCCGSCGG